jgi:hypothetical protein
VQGPRSSGLTGEYRLPQARSQHGESAPWPQMFICCAVLPYWTVSVVLAVAWPEVAVMVALPTDIPVANPLLLMVAMVVLLEVHVTELVITLVLLFE